MSEHKKAVPIAVLVFLSAGLFLGSIATNLISSDIEEPLHALLGENYRLVITIACLILASASGYLALRQTKERDAFLNHGIEMTGRSMSENNPLASGGSNPVIGRDIIVNGGDFVAHDKVTVVNTDRTPIESKSIYREKPTLDEIINELRAQPPFQSVALAKHYLGLKVSWHLLYVSISEVADDGYTVYLRVAGFPYFLATAVVDINEHPEVRVLRSERPVHVTGEISQINVDLGTIRLVSCTLMFA